MPPKRKAKDGELLAHGGTTERSIDNFHICFLTSVPEDNSGAAQRLVTEVKCRISFKAGDPYRAHIAISVTAPQTPDPDTVCASYLRFDALCVATHDLARIEIDDYKKICGENERIPPAAHCYRLVLQFDGKKLCTENIFIDHCPGYAVGLRNYLREHSKIAVYLSGLPTFITNFDDLIARFTQDRTKNPMLAHYPSNMSHPVIQKGMYLKPGDRPLTTSVAPVNTFFDWLDYMTRNGYGLIYEHEHIQNARCSVQGHQHEMFFFELLGGGDRRVMFFLRMFDTKTEGRLRANDKLYVSFDPERDATKAWIATITEALPYSPQACITGYITRPWDKEKDRYKDDYDLRAVPAKELDQPSEALTKIMGQIPHRVGLRIVDSSEHFSRCISSLGRLSRVFSNTGHTKTRQKEELQLLIGNNFDQAGKVDIYQSVSAKKPNLEDVMILNEGQAQVVAAARQAPGGYLLINGGSGTGKTYLIAEMCKPFLVDEERHRVLICSAHNNGVDIVAARSHYVLTQLQKNGAASAKKYVIRLHSYETETRIMKNDARKARPIPEGSRPKCMQDFGEEELDLIDRLDMAKLIYEEYQRSQATRYEGIDDKRVVELQLLLGYRMLQVAGLVLDEEGKHFPWAADVDDDEIQMFVQSYSNYKLGQDMGRPQSIAFRRLTNSLAERTISGADVIACTLATASNIQIAQAYKPVSGIFMDDATRIPEPFNWPVIELYGEAAWKVLVGDCDQLSPVIQSRKETNPFISQMQLSQMQRLTNAGATTISLVEQARAIPQIAALYSQVIYHDRLKHASSTALKERPIAQAMRAFNEERFRIASNVIFVDLLDSESERTSTGSVYNHDSCQLVLNLVEDILSKQIAGNDICILSPYQAQYWCFASGLEKMSKVYPQVSTLIDNDKVDRRQGSEHSTVIVDLTRSEGSGFLRDKARLNVLFSRAQNALYVVGSKKCIDSLKRSDGKFLKAFLSHFGRKSVRETAPWKCQWYNPGQVDLAGAVDDDADNGYDQV